MESVGTCDNSQFHMCTNNNHLWIFLHLQVNKIIILNLLSWIFGLQKRLAKKKQSNKRNPGFYDDSYTTNNQETDEAASLSQ